MPDLAEMVDKEVAEMTHEDGTCKRCGRHIDAHVVGHKPDSVAVICPKEL